MGDRIKNRCDELFNLDMGLDGTYYVGKNKNNKDFNIHMIEIQCDSDFVWKNKIKGLKSELKKRTKK